MRLRSRPAPGHHRRLGWPAPDPSTRVELDVVHGSAPGAARGHHIDELIAGAGFAALAFAVVATVTDALGLPPWSAVLFAAVGGVLACTGLLRRRSSHRGRPVVPANAPAVAVDLPSLTGQISGVLAVLRQQYGMAYRTRTWIEETLPAYGADLGDPTLARDLLAAAALDAGGIRADLAGLADSHPREQIVATGASILGALQNVLAACAVPTDLLPEPRPSDPSSWPPSKW